MAWNHLTKDQITEIRRRYFTSESKMLEAGGGDYCSASDLAKEYGCARAEVSAIINFRVAFSPEDLDLVMDIMDGADRKTWPLFCEHRGFVQAALQVFQVVA